MNLHTAKTPLPVTWVLTEGIAGTENQCLGVAEKLGVTPVIKRIALRQPWKSLSPYLGFETAGTFIPQLEAPWPDLLIASGRKSIAAARYIKQQSGGKTFTLQIQDPRISPRYFDLVAVPEHDPACGSNVIKTIAAPNRINDEKLAAGRKDFEKLFSPMPAQRVAVLIGGATKTQDLSAAQMADITAQLKALALSGYSLMITASRRTGDANRAILEQELKNLSNVYIWDMESANPYFGLLGWADYIIVTSDSVSMLSEAATTGKPVFMIKLAGGAKRHLVFHRLLQEKGIIKPFEGQLSAYTYNKLDDAGQIAEAVRQKSGLF